MDAELIGKLVRKLLAFVVVVVVVVVCLFVFVVGVVVLLVCKSVNLCDTVVFICIAERLLLEHCRTSVQRSCGKLSHSNRDVMTSAAWPAAVACRLGLRRPHTPSVAFRHLLQILQEGLGKQGVF